MSLATSWAPATPLTSLAPGPHRVTGAHESTGTHEVAGPHEVAGTRLGDPVGSAGQHPTPPWAPTPL